MSLRSLLWPTAAPRRRLLTVALGVALLVAAGFGWRWWFGVGPVVEGRRLSLWLDDLRAARAGGSEKALVARMQRAAKAVQVLRTLGPDDAAAVEMLWASYDLGRPVRLALRRVGPAARPFLLGRLEADSADERLRAAGLLLEIDPDDAAVGPVLRAALGADDEQAGQALLMLSRLGGPGQRPLAADLTHQLLRGEEARRGDDLRRGDAAAALARLGGPEAVTGLAEAVRDPRPTVARAALVALASLGPQAGAAVPALMQQLKRPHTDHLSDAARQTLVRVGPAAVAALTALLEGGSEGDRQAALEVLRGMGPKAAPAVPAVRRLLDQPRLRLAALETLADIDPAGRETLDVLVRSLDDRSACGLAARKLADRGSAARPAAAQLIALLGARREPRDTHLAVVRALARSGVPPADWAATFLATFAADHRFDEVVWTPAQRAALRQAHLANAAAAFYASGSAAVPTLLTALEHEEAEVRAAAALLLERVPPGTDAEPLVAALDSPRHDVRRVAAVALWRLNRSAAAGGVLRAEIMQGRLDELTCTHDDLRAMHADTSLTARWRSAQAKAVHAAIAELARPRQGPRIGGDPERDQAVATLIRLGPLPRDAIVPLVRALLDWYPFTVSSAELFASLGPYDVEAVPLLLGELTGGDPRRRDAALYFLSRMPRLPPETLPVWVDEAGRRRRDGGPTELFSAPVVLLGKIGPRAVDAVPLLLRRYADNDERPAVLDALSRIDPLKARPLLIVEAGSSPRHAVAAARALARDGAAEEAVVALRELALVGEPLDRDDEALRSAAVQALGDLVAVTPAAQGALGEVARRGPASLREAAGRLLR